MAVAAGAYSAHGGADGGAASQWLEKGARYQMYHALALLALAQWAEEAGRAGRLAGLLFCLGMLLFSGGLYAMALFSWPVVPLIPVGGVSFIGGWLCLGLAAWRAR
ncbi:MAG TPA: DUF423 domain-containing protein [Rhodospirillaceae bacterium]|nr:DUF423 domain-containing protein [Rhodospirillaceae bacterium]